MRITGAGFIIGQNQSQKQQC